MLQKLLSIGSVQLSDEPITLSRRVQELVDQHGPDLLGLLRIKNGFYAFESALHVLPATLSFPEININSWNDPKGWVSFYNGLSLDSILFFAHDIFGTPVGLRNGKVVTFDPETGLVVPKAGSLTEWVQLVLAKPNFETGYEIAREWQKKNGPLSEGERLIPVTPFIAGGEFAVANLIALNLVRGMRLRSEIWKQVKDLPEGTKFYFKFTD